MRDYATLNCQTNKNKKRVTFERDFDWWAEKIFYHLGKILYLIILLLLILTVYYVIQLGRNNHIFPVQKINLIGDSQITNPSDIKRILQDVNQKSFFNLDISKISNELESLSWIKEAHISRKWPAELNIELIERVPAYRWGENELVDLDGFIFKDINHQFQNLPKLMGPRGSELNVIKHYQLYTKLFEHSNDLKIKQFVLNRYLSWEIYLKDNTIIKLGREKFENRVKRFAKAYQESKVPNLADIQVIDLRYNRGFAIKWYRPQPKQSKQKDLINVSQTQI